MKFEHNNIDLQMEYIEAEYNTDKAAAALLGITLDEYYDFVYDMSVNPVECTADELEQMYVQYCQEYEIPCLQIAIGDPVALIGAQ